MKKRKPTDIEMQLIRLLWQALDIIRNHGADADADYIDKQLNKTIKPVTDESRKH
jgi:hypothetical protein